MFFYGVAYHDANVQLTLTGDGFQSPFKGHAIPLKRKTN